MFLSNRVACGPKNVQLWRDDVLVPLPPKPFAVLATLVAHAGQVVTKGPCLTRHGRTRR